MNRKLFIIPPVLVAMVSILFVGCAQKKDKTQKKTQLFLSSWWIREHKSAATNKHATPTRRIPQFHSGETLYLLNEIED